LSRRSSAALTGGDREAFALPSAASLRLSCEYDGEEQSHHGQQGDCLFHWFYDVFSFSNYCTRRRSAFDRTASRIPLASNALVIEFTQLALSAFAHRCQRVVGISTMRSAKTRHAIPSHHASFLLRVAILGSSFTPTATRRLISPSRLLKKRASMRRPAGVWQGESKMVFDLIWRKAPQFPGGIARLLNLSAA
jgi:hypothetical protein